MRRAGAVAVGTTGTVLTVALVVAAVDSTVDTVMVTAILLSGPAWALSFCLASTEADFAGGGRSRAEWLRLLPWTFLMAPLVVPNFVLLASFFRDARADGGRSPLTWDRMRPGEGADDGR